MNYTSLEQQAIIKILCDMMMIDGQRDSKESQYLAYVKQMLGLSMVSSDSPIDQATALSIIAGMTDDQKIEVAGILQQIITAEDVLDEKEMYFFGQIVIQTGIDKAVERKTSGMNSNTMTANLSKFIQDSSQPSFS